MSTRLDEILQKIGWVDGTKIPVANTENVALEKEIERLRAKRHRANTNFDRTKTRFSALEEHMKFLKQENDQNLVRND